MIKKFFKVIVSMIILGTVLFNSNVTSAAKFKKNSAQYVYTNTPTLYIHGFGGGPGSSNHMIAAVEKANAGKKTFTAKVAPNGKVTLTGKWDNHKVNPLVQVLFQNNRNHNQTQNATWIKNVVVLLQKRYKITQFNVVAHSAGTSNTLNYIYKYRNQKGLPKLNKYVSMAGTYNGIRGRSKMGDSGLNANGQPKIMSPQYKTWLPLRQDFPTYTKVLNIYGNLEDGSNSDGRVQNNSSKSLKYLAQPRAASYQEKEFTGKTAQHSRLHNNAAVDKVIIQFFFAK